MTKPLFIARLAGTQEEMGTQHGALVADDAAELVAFYRTMPERMLVGDASTPGGAVARVAVRGLATAWQASLARERPSDLRARSRAFMKAAGVRGTTAQYTLATMDALQNCVSFVARSGLGPFATMPNTAVDIAGHRSPSTPLWKRLPLLEKLAARAAATAEPACTSVIAWGDATADGELLFARNFDFPGVGVWDAAPAFVINAPTGGQRYAFFARRGADIAAVTCVNEAGLVIAPHTRWHVGAGWRGAMIVDLVHDIARRAETLDDAIRIARERPISSTWGIAVGSAREKSGLVLEIAGPDVEVVRPAAGASYLACANRYRTSSLQAGQAAASTAWALHSERREAAMRALVDARTAPLTPETVARFMGHREDVDAPGPRRRIGSVIAQPTNVHCAVIVPAKLRALVGVDQAPCCEGRWAELSWTWDGANGGWEIGALPAASGVSAHTRDDLVAPQDDATRHVHEAVRVYEAHHDIAATRAALERAVAAAPDDPSLHLAAAWLALESDDGDAALSHIDAGLALEPDTYRRGQLLLWGARAARTRRDSDRTARFLDELGRLDGHLVDELQRAAAKPHDGRPHVNLVMADAF